MGFEPGSSAVLLIDDDDCFLKACTLLLRRAGFQVDGVSDARLALERSRARRYDAIVCDIRMPHADGISVLREVRARDPQVPFILMTGAPTVETAITAMQLGALRYLPKPFDFDELVQVVSEAVARHALDAPLASLHRRLDGAMASLWLAYQPIVQWSARRPKAYEALLRSTDPTITGPMEILELAERTERVHQLGRLIRARAAADLEGRDEVSLFVNLHPLDLADDALYDPRAPLSRVASRVVLELTERATLALEQLPARLGRLRLLGYRIAIDDLGAGYAGLSTFARAEPEFVKLDASLVRGIDDSLTRQRVVRSVAELAEDLGIEVVAECIETAAECATITGYGIDLLQGYYLGRPARPFAEFSGVAGAEAAAA